MTTSGGRHQAWLATGLFLAFAVALFATILTGYAGLRFNDPEAYSWAPSLLDRRLGLVAAGTALTTCVCAAGSLRYALAGKPGVARIWLSLAFLGGASTLAARAVEFPSVRLAAGLALMPAVATPAHGSKTIGAVVRRPADASLGKTIFLGTCAACHAPDGSGVKGQGQNLRTSTFLAAKSADQALAFVKAGRQPFDPESKLHLAMPARGGNPSLSDLNLLDAIAYVRELEKAAAAIAATPAAGARAVTAAPPAPALDQPQMIDGQLWLPHSILPAGHQGPAGTSRAEVELQKPGAEGHREGNVRRFFTFLLFAEGLHSVYLLFGLAMSIRLLISAAPGTAPGNPLAVAAGYLVVIAAIGLVLVPTLRI